MKLTFLGAAQTVTGSCFLIQTARTTFLIECGLHQGLPIEEALNDLPFPFRIADIDFMLLTHAHIDHSGRIPKLYVNGFRKPIYTTKATAELCGIMLPDAGHIQEQEHAWNKRKDTRAGRPSKAPLFKMQDGIDACRLFSPVPYDLAFKPAEDVRVIFRDAGHILGSAILEIWVTENGKDEKIVFSGDLGNKGVPLMRDPSIIDGADYLVIESTYGDRLHSDRNRELERFIRIIEETIARGGDVIIPSFAIGRTQELIYALNREEEKYREDRLALLDTPVYIDSPLAISATQIFRRNTESFDEEARQYIASGDKPLDFSNLHFVSSAEESRALNDDPASKVIISSSGMCDAGRIQHHLKHHLWRDDSAVIFVGFQAVGTLGRQLVDGVPVVQIHGEDIAVHARIEMIDGFSGHADRDALLAWIEGMQQKPARILLVHGEPPVIESFQHSIQERFGIAAEIAELGQTVILGPTVARPALIQVQLPDRQVSDSVEQLEKLQAGLTSLINQMKAELRADLSKESLQPALTAIQEQLEQALKALNELAGKSA